MSIGSQLRQRREELSLSLDQVAQATHIRLHYLEALEADKFELLPSTTQLRGFLRAYGDYLKLDTSELIRSLERGSSAALPENLPEPQHVAESLSGSSSDVIFKEIGDQLRSQRELMGLSLGDVERHTHIRVHYIQALETGDIGHLPSPVQGRGMLSNYAAFLGLNTETVLLRFADGLQADLYNRQAARNSSAQGTRSQEEGRPPTRPSQIKRLFSMDFFVGGFIIVFLLGFSIWGVLRISKLNAGKQPSPTPPSVSEILLSTQSAGLEGSATPFPNDEVSAVPPVISTTSPITATVQPAVTETAIVYAATPGQTNAPIQVNVIANQRAWMRVIVDSETLFEGRVMPGTAYSFAGNEQINLLTGDGSALRVYFNQEDLGLLGSFGEVVERVFTLAGVQVPTPAVPPTSTPAPTTTVTPTPTKTPQGSVSTPTPSPTSKP
jgi:cytoskeleton protein RodZ